MTHRDQLAEVRQKILELEREQQRINEQLAAYKQIRDALGVLSKTSNNAPLIPTKIGTTGSDQGNPWQTPRRIDPYPDTRGTSQLWDFFGQRKELFEQHSPLH